MEIKPTNYTANQFIGIYDGLKADKSTFEQHIQEVQDFTAPNGSDITNTSITPGRKKGQRTYDSTAIRARKKLVKAIHAALTSSAAQWFHIELKDDELMAIEAIADWFAKCSRIQFDYMVKSNFHNEIQKTYDALVGPGTAALLTDEVIELRTKKFDKLKYETWATREFVFSEGADELPTMVMRMHRMTADKAYNKWAGHPRFKGLGKEAQAAFDSPTRRYIERHEYLEVFYRRFMYSSDKSNMPMHMPWGYCVVDYKGKKKIVEGGKLEQAVAIGRWDKNADDNGWGRSPSIDALPTIKTLNDIMFNGIGSLKKDLNPPLVISYKGVIGNVRTHDGGIIYKRRGAELEQLESKSRYDAAQLYQEGFKDDIKGHYFVDMIELTQNDSKTLGEFQQRYINMMRLLGPTYGRLTYEIFNPTLYRTFHILLRNGVFPEMPQELYDVATNPDTAESVQLDVRYTGPLARSQRSEEVDAITLAYTDAAGIAQATGSVEAFDWLDVDGAMQLSTELRGVPSEAVRTMDQVMERRKQRAEAEKKQRDLEEAGAEAEVMDKQAEAGGKVMQMRRGMQE